MPDKVLIIDTDLEFARSVAELLLLKGYEVVVVANVPKGIEIAKTETPAVTLLDIASMTKDAGSKMTEEIYKTFSFESTLVIMTDDIKNNAELLCELKPDGSLLSVAVFLEKPVKPEIVLNVVEDAILDDLFDNA